MVVGARRWLVSREMDRLEIHLEVDLEVDLKGLGTDQVRRGRKPSA